MSDKDTIHRQAAIEALGERPMVWTDDDHYALGERNQYDMDKLAIETVPSAQPELGNGKWIHGREVYREYMGKTLMMIQYSHWECSVCGYRTENEPLWNFCPNCGARMGGGKDEC